MILITRTTYDLKSLFHSISSKNNTHQTPQYKKKKKNTHIPKPTNQSTNQNERYTEFIDRTKREPKHKHTQISILFSLRVSHSPPKYKKPTKMASSLSLSLSSLHHHHTSTTPLILRTSKPLNLRTTTRTYRPNSIKAFLHQFSPKMTSRNWLQTRLWST